MSKKRQVILDIVVRMALIKSVTSEGRLEGDI